VAGIRNFRNAVSEVPETVERARQSLANLDTGVQRANVTMLILGIVAVAALGLASVALLRASAVARANS
jgi:hypothetical protein